MSKRPALTNIDRATHRRFDRAKQRSQDRQGRDEIGHDEFLRLLLDCWELFEPRAIKRGDRPERVAAAAGDHARRGGS